MNVFGSGRSQTLPPPYQRPNRLTARNTRPQQPAGPQTLGQALSQLIALRGLARSRGDAQLADVWTSIARSIDPAIPAQTKAVAINRGALQVAVTSAALLSELSSFHKPALLAALRQEHPHLKIRDLKFKLRGDLAAP